MVNIEDSDEMQHCAMIKTIFMDIIIIRIARLVENIRIYHECEGRIGKSVPRITEGRIILPSHDFLLTTVFIYLFIHLFQNKLPEVPKCAKMQFHMMKLLDVVSMTQVRNKKKIVTFKGDHLMW